MNHDLRAALEKLAACRAELEKRTDALKAANDRLAAFLGVQTMITHAKRGAP
ncbi:MAG TPA: hypothetical protein VF405_00865 [Gammaproteobacteria bacterium]